MELPTDPEDLEPTELTLDEMIEEVQKDHRSVFLHKQVVLMSPLLYAQLKEATGL